MSDPLQRLLAQARGAPDPSRPTIQPLLAPRYANSTAGSDEQVPRETQIEATTFVRTTPMSANSLQAVIPSLSSLPGASRVREDHEPVGDMAPDAGAARARPGTIDRPPAPHAEGDRRRESDESTGHRDMSRARELPSRAAFPAQAEPVAEREGKVFAPSAVLPQPHRDPVRAKPVFTAVSMPSRGTVATERDAATPEAPAPAITISIGHVEVRGAAAPAPLPPRRPAFKPAVSLAAFLGRDGSRER
jgi:hypothetical protein